MEEKLRLAVESVKEEAVETLVRWVRQKSVRGEAEEGAPFGRDVLAMQRLALEDMRRLGFTSGEVPGYASFCDLGEGDTREALGILGHLDVVPVGKLWEKDPFGGEIIDGKVYGRGTSDDKGPMVAALYAMEAVRRAGIPLKKKVRLILGCDEETGVESIIRYKEKEIMPRQGFSPDAEYPVINIEKGGCHVELEGALSADGPRLIAFRTGERPNVIPGEAEAVLVREEGLEEKIRRAAADLNYPVRMSLDGDRLTVVTTGKGGHAAMGENASNAIGQMLLILRAIGVGGGIAAMADLVGMTYFGENLGIAMEDAVSGRLTCSLDIIDACGETGVVKGLMDIRYPVLMDPEQMLRVMKATCDGRLEARMVSCRKPHFVSDHSALVKGLMAAYEEFTGQHLKPLAIGGGTYAGSMDEGVAFGALFPGEEDLAHQPNEMIRLESFYANIALMASAIVKLAG